MAFVAVLLVCVVGASSAAVIDTDSPSPASQRLVGAGDSFTRPVETIDDLMNALAQVTKSKGKYKLPRDFLFYLLSSVVAMTQHVGIFSVLTKVRKMGARDKYSIYREKV